MATRARKLEKAVDYEKGVVTITVLSTGQAVVANAAELPKEIAAKLVPLALNHRLGDAAAGKDGEEAFEAISKVWEGLKAGNFTIRTPAQKGLTKSDLKDKLAGLKGDDAKNAAELLKKMGIIL